MLMKILEVRQKQIKKPISQSKSLNFVNIVFFSIKFLIASAFLY